MQKQYEAPELTLIGEAQEVVMGPNPGCVDCGFDFAPDFEFERD